jgi:2-dehydropantoate 2-reductase
MKLLVVGAGIIGDIYGWALAEAGHAVTHLVRPGKSAQFANGLKIDMYDTRKGRKRSFIGTYVIQVTETLHSTDGYELVIVPTKHYHLAETLKQVVPQTEEADYLLLTQNWRGTHEIDALLPPSRYVYGDAKAGGAFEGDTLVATISSIDIGQVGGRRDEVLSKAVALCRSADLPAHVHDNILHYLWVQYAITGGLWPALVRAGSFQEVLGNRQIGKQGLRAAGECLEIVARRGVDLKKYPEARMYLNTSPVAVWMASLAIKFMFRFNKAVRRSSLHALNDAEEVRVFFYDLLNTGRELGVAMPVMGSFEPDIRRFACEQSKP